MSHHSGFSSASRMEIDRLNLEAAKTAAENAAKDARIAAMEAMLAANGLLNKQPTPGTSGTQGASTQAAHQGGPPTPGGRKRHSSQQLGGTSRGSRKGGLNRSKY